MGGSSSSSRTAAVHASGTAGLPSHAWLAACTLFAPRYTSTQLILCTPNFGLQAPPLRELPGSLSGAALHRH